MVFFVIVCFFNTIVKVSMFVIVIVGKPESFCLRCFILCISYQDFVLMPCIVYNVFIMIAYHYMVKGLKLQGFEGID